MQHIGTMSKRRASSSVSDDYLCGDAPRASESTSASLGIHDMLPPLDTLEFYVVLEVPQFLKALTKSLASVSASMPVITLWFHNSKERLDREHAAGKNLSLRPFAGLCVDSANQGTTFMAVARVPVPFDKIVINKFEAGERVDEVGVTLNSKHLLNAINDIKEYKVVILYKLRAEEKLVVYQVSQCRDPFSFEIGLLDVGDQTHELYPDLDIEYELTLPAGTMQEAVSRQKTSDSHGITFELRRWARHGLTFVVKPNFTAMQVLYAPMLSKHMSPESVTIMRRLDDAKKRFDAMDPARPLADRRLECGIEAAEVDVRTALFKLYDDAKTPVGFTKPPRRSSACTPLDECEDELRTLFNAIHQATAKSGAAASLSSSPDDAMLGMHVALLDTVSTYTNAITDAPVRQDAINKLELLYSVNLSKALLQDIFKQTGSSTVMLAIPKLPHKPLSIKYDLGATNSDAFIAWILAPIVKMDD